MLLPALIDFMMSGSSFIFITMTARTDEYPSSDPAPPSWYSGPIDDVGYRVLKMLRLALSLFALIDLM